MSATYRLNGMVYADMVKSGAANLRENAQTVNELNVFPIPDGDTGENMARTIEGGVGALDTAASDKISAVASTMAGGMLLAARGNSGVILSQFFEGMRKGLEGLTDVGVKELRHAFRFGVKQAYSAVVQPTEGTILTVMREACDKTDSVADSASIEQFFDVFIDEMYASLERTPDLLPVLREAGVIDSGGAGFVYIIEGMSRALRGETVTAHTGHSGFSVESAATADDSKFTADSPMQFGYCTEAIVQLMNKKTDAEKYDVKELISYLESIGGESIVAFKTGTRIKLHVHTFEPDRVFEYCRKIGEFVTVKVENMSIQHNESVVRNRFERQTPKKMEKKPYACVVVADGEGLIEQFKSLGADYVIDGKQTMNPSTQDFITAFDDVNADSIFVFPNNSNVILTANQAAKLYKKSRIYVVESTTLAEGYSAMSMLDYSPGDPFAIKQAFSEAIENTTTGLVSYAVRDCVMNGCEIKKGDWIGFADKKIISASKDITECACELLDKISKKDKSIILAIRGKDGADDKTVAKIAEHLQATAPEIEFYDFQGDQDVYAYIFVVE